MNNPLTVYTHAVNIEIEPVKKSWFPKGSSFSIESFFGFVLNSKDTSMKGPFPFQASRTSWATTAGAVSNKLYYYLLMYAFHVRGQKHTIYPLKHECYMIINDTVVMKL